MTRPNRTTRSNPDDPTTLLVPLTQGKFAVIDLSDESLVCGFNWCAARRDAMWYAVRTGRPERGEPTKVYLHRWLMGLPDGVVDHWDRDGLNCRRSNLRTTDQTGNGHNSAVRSHSRSGYKGVVQHVGGRWRAYIWFHRKCYALGYFDTPEEAARAYDVKARELHGDYARLNFP